MTEWQDTDLEHFNCLDRIVNQVKVRQVCLRIRSLNGDNLDPIGSSQRPLCLSPRRIEFMLVVGITR